EEGIARRQPVFQRDQLRAVATRAAPIARPVRGRKRGLHGTTPLKKRWYNPTAGRGAHAVQARTAYRLIGLGSLRFSPEGEQSERLSQPGVPVDLAHMIAPYQVTDNGPRHPTGAAEKILGWGVVPVPGRAPLSGGQVGVQSNSPLANAWFDANCRKR